MPCACRLLGSTKFRKGCWSGTSRHSIVSSCRYDKSSKIANRSSRTEARVIVLPNPESERAFRDSGAIIACIQFSTERIRERIPEPNWPKQQPQPSASLRHGWGFSNEKLGKGFSRNARPSHIATGGFSGKEETLRSNQRFQRYAIWNAQGGAILLNQALLLKSGDQPAHGFA